MSASLLSLVLIGTTPAPALGWTLQEHYLHEFRGTAQVFVGLDNSGKQHIVYEQWGEIHYRTNKSGQWITQTIFPESLGQVFPVYDAYVTGAGDVYVAYGAWLSSGKDVLRYATNAGGSWRHRPAVPTKHRLNRFLSIVARQDTIFILYEALPADVYDSTPLGLWLRTIKPDGTGSTRRVAAAPHGYNDVAVDRQGKVHAVASRDNSIRYYTNRSGSWRGKTISGAAANSFPQLAMNGSKAHVAWFRCANCDGSADHVMYATNQGGSWTRRRVTPLGKGGTPYIAYSRGVHLAWYRQEQTTAEIHYRTHEGGKWSLVKKWKYPKATPEAGWGLTHPSVDALDGWATVAYGAEQYYADPKATYIHVRRE